MSMMLPVMRTFSRFVPVIVKDAQETLMKQLTKIAPVGHNGNIFVAIVPYRREI
jgi:hypothetical protein